TSCGHAALDIRDRKISHQGPRARLPKTRRQPETGGRVCRYGSGRSLCHGKELERQKGILVIIRVAQTVSGIHKSETNRTTFRLNPTIAWQARTIRRDCYQGPRSESAFRQDPLT